MSAMAGQQASLAANDRAARSVFVGNIPYEATEETMKEIFQQVGPVASFRIVYDRESGKPKGYGFCEYQDIATAESAKRNLNNTDYHGRPLRVGAAAGDQSNAEMKAMQQGMSGPIIDSPYGEAMESEKAPEAISKAVASLPPEQMFELMKQMKLCVQNNPNEARNMLLQNPQLAYALLQAQIVMKIVDPQVAMAMLHRQSDQIPPVMPSNPTSTPMDIGLPQVSRDDQVPPTSVQQSPTSMPSLLGLGPGGAVARGGLLGDRPPALLAESMAGPPQREMNNPPMRDMGAPMQRDMVGPPRDIDARQRDISGPPRDIDIRQREMVGPPRDIDARQRDIGGPMQRDMGGPMQRDMGGPMQRDMGGPVRDMGGPMRDMGGPQRNMGGPHRDMGPGRDAGPMRDMGGRDMAGQPQRGQGVGPGPGGVRGPPRQEMGPSRLDAHRPDLGPASRLDAHRPDLGPASRLDPHRPDLGPASRLDTHRPDMGPERGPVDSRGGHDVRDPRGGGDPRGRGPAPARPQLGPGGSSAPNGRPAPGGGQTGGSITSQDQEKAALIMQVLQLSDEQIAMLPPDQRQSILILKEQISSSGGLPS